MLLADTGDGPLTPASFSMHMMIFTEGKLFTAGELRGLLEERGFVEFRAEPASGSYSLVSARKLLEEVLERMQRVSVRWRAAVSR